MDTTEKITVEVEGEREEVEGVLESLGGDVTWTIRSGEEGVLVAEIETKEGDMRKEIARAFASAGCPLLTLKKETVSLEDVFLELTEKEPEATEDAEENVASEEEVDLDDADEYAECGGADEYDEDDQKVDEEEVEDAGDL